MNAYLSQTDWATLICSNPDALHAWEAFTETLEDAINLFVPSRVTNQSNGTWDTVAYPKIWIRGA